MVDLFSQTVPTELKNEGFALLSIFKNAISFTLALTTLDELSRSSPDYLVIILSTLVIISLVLVIQVEVNAILVPILKNDNDDNYTVLDFVKGPLRCLSFLTSIVLNILTQFLSTLSAKYILTFVPDPTNIYDVSYVLLIVLCLFWCTLYAFGVDWHRL